MGRTALILVVLMSTIYAGIMINLQRRLYDLPRIISRNMLQKEAESVSDYALRTAVRNSVFHGLQAEPGVLTQVHIPYTNFTVGNCIIDSINYVFDAHYSRYLAQSFVRGSLMNQEISYEAEIAFDFPIPGSVAGTPNVFYLEMDQPQFNPSFNRVYDTSPNANDGFFWGDVTTRPMGSGANGWKCASFGIGGGWIDFPGSGSTVVSSAFTILTYAKIRQGHANATLVWLASNPFDTGSSSAAGPGHNLRYKPTGGIYFTGGNMVFTATTSGHHVVTVTAPFTPDGKWPHNRDPWHFFALTYNMGTVRGYINGVLVGTAYAPGVMEALPSIYGFSLGRKDIRVLGPGGNSEYMYMYGLMDQVGLYNTALTADQINDFYHGTLQPARIWYIKD